MSEYGSGTVFPPTFAMRKTRSNYVDVYSAINVAFERWLVVLFQRKEILNIHVSEMLRPPCNQLATDFIETV